MASVTLPTHAHVCGQRLLTGKAVIVVPSIVQEHRIGDFGSKAEVGIFENEIGDLRKSSAHNRVVCRQLDVSLSQDVADVSALVCIPHAHSSAAVRIAAASYPRRCALAV